MWSRITEKKELKEKISRAQMLEATFTCNATYDGLFYVGVLTTRIYCLPSCKARKPLDKNIVFFHTRENAISEGFRGCKRCRAEFYPDQSPSWFNPTLNFLQEEIEKKITEEDLVRVAGVNITTIRKYFQTRFQWTPLAFYRKIRLNHARKLIEAGNNYRDVSYRCGFKSLSGFREAFTKEFGLRPGEIYNRTF